MKYILTLFLSLITIVQSIACDSCSDFDYFDINNKGYIGLSYRYSYLNGYNNIPSTGFKVKSKKHSIVGDRNIYTPSNEDYEAFHTVDLRFNYSLKKKVNFLVVVPYNFSYDYRKSITPPIGATYDSTIVQKGLGDLYFIVSGIKNIEKNDMTHILKPGIGFSLPTGKFQVRSPNGIVQDPIHQPGRGAVDFIAQFNYTLKYQERFGIFSTNRYYISLKSKETQLPASGGSANTLYHRFGNRFSSTSFLFYTLGAYNLKFIPKLGVHYEFVQNDYLNNEPVEDLGGNSLFLSFGVDIKYQDITFLSYFKSPIHQELNGDQLLNSGRFSLGVMYNF